MTIKDLIKIPYDTVEVRKAIEQEKELEALRMRIYRAIKNSYDEEQDMKNVKRVSDACLEEGIRLVGGRFSRAFYIDAMLLASSKVIPGKILKGSIRKLEKTARALSINFRSKELRKSGINSEFMLPDVQRMANLSGKDRVSLAEIEGTVRNLKESLRKFESLLSKEVDRIESERVKQIVAEKKGRGKSRVLSYLLHDRGEIQTRVQKLRNVISEFEEVTCLVSKKDAAFVVFFQRIFPIDAINMGMMNERKEPFFGEDEEVLELIEKSSSNIYTSPNLKAWLRKCDDWVEALPAYATYQIIPSKGGYKIMAWVQRSILEDMYRRHAEDWALNIEEVMALEHIDIARRLLLSAMNLKGEMLRFSQRRNVSEGEAARQIVRKKGWGYETAVLSAIVEETYNRLCLEVAEVSRRDGISRFEALEEVIRNERGRGNLFRTLLNKPRPCAQGRGKSGSSFVKSAERIVGKNKLEGKVEKLVPLSFKKRRALPCAHVLTTLGPGETEINIQNWLEESMALFNVCRAHGLEGRVKERVARYRRILVSAGEHVIDELALQGALLDILREEGESSGSDGGDSSEAILKLIAGYPEAAQEVGKLALIIEKTGGGFTPGKEPVSVLEYIEKHPQLEREAAEKCKASGRDSADYLTEVKSTVRSLARTKVLDELGASGEVGSYLRNHLDPMAAATTAQREIISEENLSGELNSPRFRYEATGAFKKYNLLYTPSRVDLGAEEIYSVRNVPKWVGGLDWGAAASGKELYSLYNVAGPTAVESPRLAEFLKVGENFFSRGGVFYLSLAAGVNIDALGIGDFEFFRNEWNKRGDRTVLPTGETYGGFCVPKEFSLLYAIIIAAVNPETRDKVLDSFHVDERLREEVIKDLRKLLQEKVKYSDDFEWEMKAAEFLRERYKEYFSLLSGGGYVARLPQLVKTMEKAGVMSAQFEEEKQLKYEFAYWVNKKAQGLEEINRSGPFRKIYLIRELIKTARGENPGIVPDNKLIGVMGASYKEGQRKHGREIPVTDVRFSAGARKLEIYAGTAEKHLLKDVDPEGRDILGRMFKDFVTPADMRLVGTCGGSDLLNHVPGSGLEDVKEDVYKKLIEAGLDDSLIDANCAVYGGDIESWSVIKEMDDKKRRSLLQSIGGKIHLLVVDRRGVYRNYEEAVQGVDFIDLGIPDPELLDLIDNLPKLLYLMRKGRPDSALVFADGTSGARRRTFSFHYPSGKRKVKELFALDSRAVYGALGLGVNTIESWRVEMAEEREKADALLKAIVERNYRKAEQIYRAIVREIIVKGKVEDAIREELKARDLGLPLEYYRYVSRAYSSAANGLPVSGLDFGTWLILGGQYLCNGNLSFDQVRMRRAEFEKAAKGNPPTPFSKGGLRGRKPFGKAEVDRIVEMFIKLKYLPPAEGIYREVETGIAGSLKAVEEKVSRLGRIAERQRQARRARLLTDRIKGFASVEDAVEEVVGERDFRKASEFAMESLPAAGSSISQESFGKFIGWLRGALIILLEDLPRAKVSEAAGGGAIRPEEVLNGGEIDVKSAQLLSALLAKAAEGAGGNKSGPCAQGRDKELLEAAAKALELLDIALLIEKTTGVEGKEEMLVEIARFFDLTLNSHVFDYLPYHYTKLRGAGFEVFSREEKFELSERHHRWLYTHIRHLMVTETIFGEVDQAYQEAWLGDADRGVYALGINPVGESSSKGASVENPSQRFWFNYARLRDAAVLVHEGYPMPEIFIGLDPDLIKCGERTNVIIVYPHGNTTVPVALEQGGKLSEQEGINLMLTAFPSIVEDSASSQKLLQVNDGFMYISRHDYARIMARMGAGIKGVKSDGDGILILAKFSRPVTGHAIFFHFTHPMRLQVNRVSAPIIQPFLWEAATHLKCRLPGMLKGSGVRCPSQVNWYQRDTENLPSGKVRREIERKLIDFSGKYPTIIVKPEKESGGRNAKILPVRENNKILKGNLAELRELVYAVSKTDNVVMQEVIPCGVKRLYTTEFLENLVDRFVKIGIPVRLNRSPETPLFSYFRQILVRGRKGDEISHHITVLSTQGIANVGQGGLLYEYRDEIINEKYRDDLRREITRAAYNSMKSQRKYIRARRSDILRDYLSFHTEYGRDMSLLKEASHNTEIPYEMGDYMSVFLVDENDNLVQIYDEKKEELLPLFDEKGNPTSVKVMDKNGKRVQRVDKNGRALPIPMFNEKGRRIARFDANGKPVSLLTVVKIEANPGAGLWRPHDDQLPPDRKGEGVYKIFRCLGEQGKVFKEKNECLC